MTSKQVWVIDDDRAIRWVLERALTQAGLQPTCFEDAGSALDQLDEEQPSTIVTDIRMPGMDGLSFLGKVRERFPDVPVIIM
ncbi:MAG: response regulator, partial [Perlucidibaca sp.]